MFRVLFLAMQPGVIPGVLQGPYEITPTLIMCKESTLSIVLLIQPQETFLFIKSFLCRIGDT